MLNELAAAFVPCRFYFTMLIWMIMINDSDYRNENVLTCLLILRVPESIDMNMLSGPFGFLTFRHELCMLFCSQCLLGVELNVSCLVYCCSMKITGSSRHHLKRGPLLNTNENFISPF